MKNFRRNIFGIVLMGCALWLGVTNAAFAELETTFAVLPFESFPSQGASQTTSMEVAELLAQRLQAAGATRVVAPNNLEKVSRRPDMATVKQVGAEQAVVGVISGATTRIGTHLSVDVQLHSALTGALVATLVEEVANPAALSSALDRIAGRILQLVRPDGKMTRAGVAKLAPPPASVKSGAPVADAAQKGAAKPSADKASASFAASKEPMSITADQLEMVSNETGRTIVFVGHVKLTQGPLLLTSEKLEAVYVAGASDPDRIVATRNVQISQSGKSVSCDQATYQRKTQRVICRGNASMQQGVDRAWGDEIEFQLDTERLLIRGGAKVMITPDSKAKGSGS